MASQPGSKIADNRSQGGYECEFVTPPPAYFQTECSICLQVLRSPHLASCCGNNFCKVCIGCVQKDGKSCPLCKAKKFNLTYNRTHNVAVNQLEVYCTLRKIGCKWKGKLEKLDKHLNSIPEREKQLEGCAFVQVQCCHDGCGQSLQRRLIVHHQSKECPQRPFLCEYCRSHAATYHVVTAYHWPECESYPLPCPNKCMQNAIERQNLKQHLNEDCPLQEVECEFKYAGCEAKLPRKDMPEHLKESVIHVTLLARQNRELTTKLLERDNAIKRIAQETRREMETVKRLVESQQERLNEKERQIIKLTQEHRRDMERLEREVKNKIMRLKENVWQRMRATEVQLEGYVNVSKRKIEEPVRGLEQRQDAAFKQIHGHLQIAPVAITMTNFQQHWREKGSWFSKGIYTHPQGYQMCLRVDANGCGEFKGSHVSCYVCLMLGEFDNHLKWPFRGVVTIQLLNQREYNNHRSMSVAFDGKTPAEYTARVTSGERNNGWGYGQFIAHSKLGHVAATNCQYLMSNCLQFRIKVELK